jgi:hypothetical protein
VAVLAIVLAIGQPSHAQKRSSQHGHTGSSAGGSSSRLTPHSQDFEFDIDDEIKIRLQQPRRAFDDKGNPKKYSPAELKQLRGQEQRNVPGYPAEFADLKTGRAVTIYFVERDETFKPEENSQGRAISSGTLPKAAGHLTGWIIHVDAKKKKLTVHVDTLSVSGSSRYRRGSKDAASAVLADRQISTILVAARTQLSK